MRSFIQQSSQLCRKQPRIRTIFLVWAVVVMLVAAVAPTFADDDTTVTIRSPLRVTDIESLEMGTSLKLAADGYSMLSQHRAVRLTEFPLSRDESVELELERFYVTTPATRIVVGTPNGDIPIAPPNIALFRGHIAGVADSRVILGISPRGFHSIVWVGQDGYVITPLRLAEKPDTDADHVVHRLSELRVQLPAEVSECGVQTTLTERPAPTVLSSAEQASVQSRVARLALECDYEYWDQFDDYGLALDYIYLLFGAIGEIYERDVSVKLALTFIRIWTTVNDPYSYVGGGVEGLQEFQDYWNANHSTPGQSGFVERDLAHLLSSRGVGAWGNNGVLCSYSSGYSISGGNALGSTPAQSLIHDIAYAGHELGHNFNAMHTHCFDPPIDKCATEPNCNDTQDCSTAPSTIMSYCHNCPGGYANILHEFHASNVTRMRSHIDSSCLRLARNPSYVDWRNTGFEDGTAAWPYNTVKEGTEAVLPGGTVSIANGNYPEQITIWQPMTLNATGGSVIIGE
jgi:hypothetical protein